MAISNNTTGLRPGVCTSSSRPSAPYEGQMIYEIDTDKVLVWNGSAWYPNWNTAWGFVDSASATATTSIVGATPLLVLSKAITLIAGRRYKVSAYLGFQPSANTTGNYVYIQVPSVLSKHLWYRGDQIAANYPQHINGFYVGNASAFGVTSGSSAVTFNLYIRTGGNGALNTFPDGQVAANSAEQLLLVEDIGPA
jgi:hypothetical protein